ncbi:MULTISPECIES: acyltransferase domain-containing protein [unclassified Methylobacterium]|jgi:[acyl-carrier-protein] S-malonyltransferase|uniref:acyltransferase domain-containing protein n=1 Tax=unclassified Methylobacterium TaxID=2615210 RepID=UPI0013552088|nr:acyltransferase domain-containing protein [Methylobacterium sp. 2A]MWV24159.1 acyltransferase domain-containing protein [Methylobacterium sp. 2A]
MTLALLLSGQGGQHPGMFDLTADHPEAQAIFAAAKPLLDGADPRDVVRAGGSALHENRTGQILCCVAALAGWRALGAAGAGRLIVAGYSIGDLAAWGVAGRFEPNDVLTLAARRAEAMDAATGAGFGLAGVRGLGLVALEALAEQHGCHLAIRNAPDSGVVGGACDALEALCRAARARGAQRAVLLPVRTPSHTPLLAEATAAFRTALNETAVRRPPPGSPRLVSGLDGTFVFRSEDGMDKLARQISTAIDWAACLEACREYGADQVLELGPGHALATMARSALPEARVHALEEFRTIAGVSDWVGRP